MQDSPGYKPAIHLTAIPSRGIKPATPNSTGEWLAIMQKGKGTADALVLF